MSKGTDFIRDWLDAANRGDLDALVGMCTPDVELSNPDGVFRGGDGVRANFKTVVDALSERQSEVRTVVEQGDTLAVEFTFRGRHTGPLDTPQGAVPPTGKIFALTMIAIFEFRDGKVAASRGQYDRMGLAAQLGLLPGAPAAS